MFGFKYNLKKQFFLGILFVSSGQLTARFDSFSFHYFILIFLFFTFITSTEIIFEEKYLKQADISPLLMTGCEGVSGVILSTAIALPVVNAIHGSDCGKYENVADGLVMLRQSVLLLLLSLGFSLSDSFYNVGRLMV